MEKVESFEVGRKEFLEIGGFLEMGLRGLRWICEGLASVEFTGFVNKNGGGGERCVLAMEYPISECRPSADGKFEREREGEILDLRNCFR